MECLGEDGIWCQPLRRSRPGPALFLDRDGVLVREVGFLHEPGKVELMAGAAELVARANNRGIPVVLVTNQSGIGQGYFGWPEFAATQAQIMADLSLAGAALDLVLACPFHPKARPPYRHDDHPCRKPRPGMFLRAAEVLPLDLSGSWMVGDRDLDMAAASRAGLAGGLRLLPSADQSVRGADSGSWPDSFEVRYSESLVSALELPIFEAAS